MAVAPSTTSAPASPPAEPTADPTARPSSSASPSRTASPERFGPTLAGRDLETWQPPKAVSQAVIAEIAAYCQTYCPVVHECVEDRCRLYRLERRAAQALGLPEPGEAEAVGVASFPVTAL